MSYRETGTTGSLYGQPNFEYILYGSTGTPNVGITNTRGASNSHNNVQPFLTINYIIKYEGSTVVEQNITAGDGLAINGSAGTVNLLNSVQNPNLGS